MKQGPSLMSRSGDFTGDKLGGLTDHLGGLTDHLGGLPDSEQVLGGLSDRGKPCGERVPGTGAAFAHFCDQKASGDKAVTSGDEFSGLEFAGFSGQKTEFGARRTSGAGFRRKTSELGGSGTTFDV